ncbi:MAG: hypothetical protein R3B45_02575 [Bdellovibrionota bacterium]
MLDLESLSPHELIAQYVIEVKGVGHMLPYSEYNLIELWLRELADADLLLLVLSEILPAYFENARRSGRTLSLKGIHKKVMQTARETKLCNN